MNKDTPKALDAVSERDLFEATFGSSRVLMRATDDSYVSMYVQNDWEVWQAARAVPSTSTQQAAKSAAAPTPETVKALMQELTHADRHGDLWAACTVDERAIALKVVRAFAAKSAAASDLPALVDLLTSAAWQLKQHTSDRNHVSAPDLPGKLLAAAQAIAAAKSAAPAAVAYALRFPSDSRINLSTVFDTEKEATDFAERCEGAAVVPLYDVPMPATQAPAAVGLTDEQLGAIAYSGFDSYWTEDCEGNTKEAWVESAKAVKQAVLSTLSAPMPAGAAVGGWQPIETAPDSAGAILVATQAGLVRTEVGRCVQASLRNAQDGDSCYFTHWMPIPAAPLRGGPEREWLKCDACGKDMRGHDLMGHCRASGEAL